MVAQGFYQPICFNPALVYLIAGFLIGLSLKFYTDLRQKTTRAPARKSSRRRRRRR